MSARICSPNEIRRWDGPRNTTGKPLQSCTKPSPPEHGKNSAYSAACVPWCHFASRAWPVPTAAGRARAVRQTPQQADQGQSQHRHARPFVLPVVEFRARWGEKAITRWAPRPGLSRSILRPTQCRRMAVIAVTACIGNGRRTVHGGSAKKGMPGATGTCTVSSVGRPRSPALSNPD